MEQDFHRITQRMHQIDIGKNTAEYRNYIKCVPKNQREAHHPRTPNARHKMPNKWWKTALSRWRKALHAFDLDAPAADDNEQPNADSPVKAKTTEQSKFCCEKCSDEFSKFDEWQEHRQQCDGKGSNTVNDAEKENMSPRIKDRREEQKEKEKEKILDFDDLDEDIDLDLMSTLKPKVKVEDSEDVQDVELLESLKNILEDSDNEDAII